MAQNGKSMDLLSSVEVFVETMNERFGNGNSSIFAIVSDGKQSLLASFGSDEGHMDAISTVIYQNDEVQDIIEGSLALAITAKIKGYGHDND